MRKPYIAPCCEYMTFTVDSAIASTPCANKGSDYEATFDSPTDCAVTMGPYTYFTNDACVVKEVEGYCYYTGSISIFGS